MSGGPNDDVFAAAKRVGDTATTDFDPTKFAPGTFGCHEALHMTSVLVNTVSEHLVEHPAIMLNPSWHALAEKAADALAELYQAIGQEHMND